MTFENQQTVQNPSKQEQVNGAEKNGTENVDCVKKATRLKGPEWNYDCTDLKCGPLNWLKEYGSSESGRSQSPVEIWIEDALKVSLNENCFHFVNYHKHFGGKIENTGRSGE
jgi:carbonic anhydrase